MVVDNVLFEQYKYVLVIVQLYFIFLLYIVSTRDILHSISLFSVNKEGTFLRHDHPHNMMVMTIVSFSSGQQP